MVHKRLTSWNEKCLSQWGRVIMLNSVMNNIPIFYFSFYQAPKVIIKELVKVQQFFSWEGVKGNFKINYVN